MLSRNPPVFWSIIFVVSVLLLIVFKAALAPVVLGIVLGYVLDPIVDRVEKTKCPRGLAAFLVLVGFFCVGGLVVTLVLPVLQKQILVLLETAPTQIETVKRYVLVLMDTYVAPYVDVSSLTASQIDQSYTKDVFKWAGKALQNVWSGGQALVSFFSFIVIMPIVAFYILRDWDRIVSWIADTLPRAQKKTIEGIVRDVDMTLAGFLRGQGLVCVALGLFYAIGLMIIGLESGFAIGLFIGLISFVPYIGALVGGVLCIGLALIQFVTLSPVLTVAALFGVGQFLEGNILSPKLVGDRVNLHPLWIVFALLSGGQIFGFIGVLCAVPVACIVGVFLRHGLKFYKASSLYKVKKTKKKTTKKRS